MTPINNILNLDNNSISINSHSNKHKKKKLKLKGYLEKYSKLVGDLEDGFIC